MWNLKNNINEQTKQKQTHRHREQTVGCQRGGGLGGLRGQGEEIEKCRSVVTNSRGDAKYSAGSTANNTVVTVGGARWVLDYQSL